MLEPSGAIADWVASWLRPPGERPSGHCQRMTRCRLPPRSGAVEPAQRPRRWGSMHCRERDGARKARRARKARGRVTSAVAARTLPPLSVEGVGEILRRGEAIGGELLQRGEHRVLDRGRHRGALGAERRRRLRQHLGDDGLRDGAGEGRLAGEHLVGHGAERVDVAPRVDVALAHRLLGGHVGGRAERHAGLGHATAAGLLHGEGDAEVGDQRLAILQEDVLGLDVAMDDAAAWA